MMCVLWEHFQGKGFTLRENWYMGLILLRSLMMKKRSDALSAAGRYISRASLIFVSFSLASTTCVFQLHKNELLGSQSCPKNLSLHIFQTTHHFAANTFKRGFFCSVTLKTIWVTKHRNMQWTAINSWEDPVAVTSLPCPECEQLLSWWSPAAQPEKYHPENYRGLQRGDSTGHPPTAWAQSWSGSAVWSAPSEAKFRLTEYSIWDICLDTHNLPISDKMLRILPLRPPGLAFPGWLPVPGAVPPDPQESLWSWWGWFGPGAQEENEDWPTWCT